MIIKYNLEWKSVNFKECPHDTPDFREVQCSEFNNDRRGIHGVPPNVRWVPQYAGSKSGRISMRTHYFSELYIIICSKSERSL